MRIYLFSHPIFVTAATTGIWCHLNISFSYENYHWFGGGCGGVGSFQYEVENYFFESFKAVFINVPSRLYSQKKGTMKDKPTKHKIQNNIFTWYFSNTELLEPLYQVYILMSSKEGRRN